MVAVRTSGEVPTLLSALVRQLGEDTVSGALGCDEEDLQGFIQGEIDLSPGARENLESLCELLQDSAGWTDLVGGALGGLVAEVPIAQDAGVVPRPDPEFDVSPEEEEQFLSDVPTAAVRPGETWQEEMERTRDSFRRARALAVMTQFRVGMPHQEYIASLGLVQEIELALITLFGDSVPEPGIHWSTEKRAREQELRIRRLLWVEQVQRKEWSGLKGLWNWLLGRHKLTGVELYNKVLEDADSMLVAMSSTPPLSPEQLERVMRHSGVIRRQFA